MKAVYNAPFCLVLDPEGDILTNSVDLNDLDPSQIVFFDDLI